MENIFKNKLINYEETPPDFILKNLKNKISGSNSSFIARNKYFIAASVVFVAAVSSFLFLNKTTQEKHQTISKIHNTTITEKHQTRIIKNNLVVEENAVKKGTKNVIILSENKIINTPEEKVQVTYTNKKINAGADVIVCGNTFEMAPINTENGFWLTDADIIIKDKNNPNTKIISNVEGVTHLIWKEKIADDFITDTVKISFVNYPKSDIEIEQINDICANKNTDINFITSNKYNYYWDDGFTTKQNFRNNLSAGSYTITVSNTSCSNTFNINITDNASINVDFYHTELYSAVNIPFYFTNRTEFESNENTHVNYIWDFGDGAISNEKNPEHTYTEYGDFNIKLIAIADNGCKDSLILKVKVDENEVKMPNIFTPNGDGKNDVLVLNPKPLTSYYAAVFDRSGREITHWTNVNNAWDGKLKSGDNASVGVYYYIVSGIDTEGKKFNYKSFVHLSR